MYSPIEDCIDLRVGAPQSMIGRRRVKALLGRSRVTAMEVWQVLARAARLLSVALLFAVTLVVYPATVLFLHLRAPENVQIVWYAVLLLTVFPILAVAQVSTSSLRRRLLAKLGPEPVGPPSAPARPADLDPPSLVLPRFLEPTLRLPPEPQERLPGQWNRCLECGRPLSDPTSRFRGVGPDCFRRTGIYYPQGPMNPAHADWERVVAQRRAEFPVIQEEARHRQEADRQAARARHILRMDEWESRAEARAVLESDYELRRSDWLRVRGEANERLDEWRNDPRQDLAINYARTRLFVWVWALVIVGALFALLIGCVTR